MFTHLRACSAFSLKYGTTQPRQLVARAHEYGMSALALTDRDTLAGAIRFAQSCVDYSVAPIIGVDLAIDVNATHQQGVDRGDDAKGNLPRVTLLAHSDGGWRSLCRLLTSLNTYRKTNVALDHNTTPILTLDFLERFGEYSRNLLLLHGPESPVGAAIALRRHDLAFERFHLTRDFFADHAIECVSHLMAGGGPRSTAHAAKSLIFAREHKIPAVISNAVRMRTKEDAPIADVLDSLRESLPLWSSRSNGGSTEAFLKSESEMYAIAEEISQAAGERSPRELLNTTREWAERAILSPTRDIGLGATHLPEQNSAEVESSLQMQSLLRKRCEAGLHWRYNESSTIVKARQRLDDELATVATLGYESYFLTVADITTMVRERGIRYSSAWK